MNGTRINVHYFLFFCCFTPPPDFGASTVLPCVAPPPTLLRLPDPCPNVLLSLFFSHRSGSGGGVTPGTTPLGTRDIRTFFSGRPDPTDASGGRIATLGIGTLPPGGAGGGAVSKLLMTEDGSASSA